MGITLTNAGTASLHEEDGLVSGGKGLVQRGKDWFRLISGWEGLVSGGFGSFRFLVTTVNCVLCVNSSDPSLRIFSPDIIWFC